MVVYVLGLKKRQSLADRETVMHRMIAKAGRNGLLARAVLGQSSGATGSVEKNTDS